METSLIDSIPQLLRFNNHFCPILLSVLLFFIGKACFYKRSSSQSSKMRLPPGPKPLPVLGNLRQLAGAPLHVVLHDLAKTYGPFCFFKAGQISFVSVPSSEAAKEILYTQDHMCAQSPILPVLEMTTFNNGSIFLLLMESTGVTLRLHPPAAVLARVPREDCVVHGYDIPKDSRVLINIWSLGRDPNYWENPEKFEPGRFLNSSIDWVGTHFEFLPFGSGRRVCPGAGFAVASMELMLANLFYYFDWKLADGLAPKELDMDEAEGLIVKRLNPLFVVATPFHPIA